MRRGGLSARGGRLGRRWGTTIGLYGPRGEFLLRNTNTAGPPEIVLTLGLAGSLPVAGNWEGQP